MLLCGSVAATPTPAPSTLIPAPVQQCQGLNSVNQSAGEVEYVNADNTHTECWTIECEETVVIRMTSFGSSFSSSNRVTPYSVDFRSLSTGKNHSFDRHFNNWKGTDMVLRGPVFVTFVTSAYPSASSARSYLTFDYVCTTAETPAPSTDAPFAPGVDCDVHTVLTDAGNVSYAGNDTYHVECWEIACEHDVVLSFTHIQLYASSVDVYSSGNASGNGTGFVFERSVQTGGVEVVVSGPALVQFRSTIYAGTVWSYVDFSYECRAPTPLPTDVPTPRPAPSTSTPTPAVICEDLTDAVGNVTYVNYEKRNTACWNIVCEEAVVVTMTHFSGNFPFSRDFPYTVDFRSTVAGGANRTLTSDVSRWVGVDISLAGPVRVTFDTYAYWNSTGASSQVSFEYRCAGQTEALTTDVPTPRPAPSTSTPTPAVICEDLTDAVGNVTYVNYEKRNTACWNIVCEEAVVVTMTHFSGNFPFSRDFPYTVDFRSTVAGGANRTLTSDVSRWVGVDISLAGPVRVTFDTYAYWNSTGASSQVSFEYRCAGQRQAPATVGTEESSPTVLPFVFIGVGILVLLAGVASFLFIRRLNGQRSCPKLQDPEHDQPLCSTNQF